MDINCQKCGLVNDYSIKQAGPHQSAYCNNCGSYIKHLPQENKPIVFYFGKYKGMALHDMTLPEHVSWLNWFLNHATNCNEKMRTAIKKHLGI